MENSFYYVTVVFGTVVFCFSIVLMLKKTFFNLSASTVKQLDIIINTSLQEKEKDRLILKNMSNLLKHFFLVLLLIVGIAIISSIPVFLYTKTYPEYSVDTSSIYFYLSMLLGSLSLLFIKKKSDYSYWSKLLHTIVLDNYNIGKFMLKKELKKHKTDCRKNGDSFVIVTGLARAGTTALTNLLYEPEVFHSISYANMPFLLAPKFWKKIYNPKSSSVKERAHGDKVMFGKNSIEALEEYFFKVFLKDQFIGKKTLAKHKIDHQLYKLYLSYQELFRDKQKLTQYLAKNNNFILRHESIRELNKIFKLIIVFRNPIDHANSLLRQHKNFELMQHKDPFILDYMNWLGHYEFGQNQKVFEFGNEKKWAKYKKESINYWLLIWVNYYSHVVSLFGEKNTFLVHYDDLLQTPTKLKQTISGYIEVNFTEKQENKYTPKRLSNKNLEIDDQIHKGSIEIYERLIANKLVV